MKSDQPLNIFLFSKALKHVGALSMPFPHPSLIPLCYSVIAVYTCIYPPKVGSRIHKAGSVFCAISVTLPGSGWSLKGQLHVCLKEHTHLSSKTWEELVLPLKEVAGSSLKMPELTMKLFTKQSFIQRH